MTPVDDAWAPLPRTDGTVVRVRCDAHPGRAGFSSHVTRTARGAVDEAEATDLNPRAIPPVASTASGWRLRCIGCGRDARLDRARLATVLDAVAAAGVERISLDTLTEAYQRV